MKLWNRRHGITLLWPVFLPYFAVAAKAIEENEEIIFYEDSLPAIAERLALRMIPLWKDAVSFLAAALCVICAIYAAKRQKKTE